MAGYNGRKKKAGGSKNVHGYTIQDRAGRVKYVSITNDPVRRAEEHHADGKRGILKVETRGMSRATARKWEAGRLSKHRRTHAGKNPRYNKTRSGGWKY